MNEQHSAGSTETQAVANGKDCAYPTGCEGDPGLTKRELFAAMAMQGILACDRCSDTTAANQAVAYADALLKELAK